MPSQQELIEISSCLGQIFELTLTGERDSADLLRQLKQIISGASVVTLGDNFELMGVSEVAKLLRVSKQRVSQLAATQACPRPIAQLRSGPVWLGSDMRVYALSRRTTTGAPRHQQSR